MKRKSKLILYFIVFFIFLYIILLYGNYLNRKIDADYKKVLEETYFEKFEIACTGDIFLHTSNIVDAHLKDNEYDFNYVFDEVRDLLKSSDITTCWFGGVVDTLPPYSGYPFFKSPFQILQSLKNTGFDILLRTNHVYDFGQNGLQRTNSFIKTIFLKQIGGYSSKEESEKIIVVKKGKIRVAFLSYTYGTNGLIPKESWEVDLINFKKIRDDIKKAKDVSDFIVVFFHYGNEYERKYSKFQKDVAFFASSNGADIVIGSHPHVVQPLDSFLLDDGRKVYSAYSLGNFYCGQRKKYTNSGVIFKVILERSKRTDVKVKVKKIFFLPTYIIKDSSKDLHKYKVILSGNHLYEKDDTLRNSIINSVKELKELIPEKYILY